MSNNNLAKAADPPRLTSKDASSQELAPSTQNHPGPSSIPKDTKEDEKAHSVAVQPHNSPSKTTGTADSHISSDSTDTNTNMNETPDKNKTRDNEPRSKAPSTYEIDGITYRYGVGYPGRQPPADRQTRPQWGTYPNKMSYVDGAGVKHEIHIPTGMYHRAVQLFVDKNWDELGKFPAYGTLDEEDEEDTQKGEKGEDFQSATAAGIGDAATVNDKPAIVGKDRDGNFR
ncbi:hypothetical protein V8F06_005130 [Rhypophila decipiens]